MARTIRRATLTSSAFWPYVSNTVPGSQLLRRSSQALWSAVKNAPPPAALRGSVSSAGLFWLLGVRALEGVRTDGLLGVRALGGVRGDGALGVRDLEGLRPDILFISEAIYSAEWKGRGEVGCMLGCDIEPFTKGSESNMFLYHRRMRDRIG